MKRNWYYFYIIVLLILSMIMISFTACRSSASLSSKKNKNVNQSKKTKVDIEKDSLSNIQSPYDGTEDSPWLQAVKKTGKYMADNQFQYNTSGIRNTLDKAVDGNRQWRLCPSGQLGFAGTWHSGRRADLLF